MHDGFEKDVTGGEKFMVAYNELRPPFVIQLTLEGVGDPEPEDLFDALERTSAVNPGACLRLDTSQKPCKWVIGPAPTLTVFDAPNWTGVDGTDGEFLRWPLDAYTGPTCELVFVRAKNANYLVFRAIHAVMDGQGTLLWVKDFMRCLRGEEPVGQLSPVCVDEITKQFQDKARPLPLPEALHPFGIADPDAPGDFFWRRVRAERPLDSATSGRIAVALATQARSHDEGLVRINLPTDLRHYRRKERTTGNFFNSLFLDVPPDATPEMIGLKIIQMLYKHEGKTPFGVYAGDTDGSLNVHRVKVFWDLAHLHDNGRYAFSATLSHLGVLRSADLSGPNWQTNAAFFVPLVGDSGCVVSVNGFDDHSEATVGLSDRFIGNGQLDHLAEMIRAALAG